MLDAWIIEEIAKHERRQDEERPSLRIEIGYSDPPVEEKAEEGERGVCIIDL